MKQAHGLYSHLSYQMVLRLGCSRNLRFSVNLNTCAYTPHSVAKSPTLPQKFQNTRVDTRLILADLVLERLDALKLHVASKLQGLVFGFTMLLGVPLGPQAFSRC